MVKCCCVVGCTATTRREINAKFYVIPKETNRRLRWLRAINRIHVNKDRTVDSMRLWDPASKHHYVCSAHFVSGEKSNDPCHVDFVPSIFPQYGKTKIIKTAKVTAHERLIRPVRAEPVRAEPVIIPSKKARRELRTTESPNHQPAIPSSSTTSNDQPQDLPSTEAETENPSEVTALTRCEHPLNKPLKQLERKMLCAEIINLRKERDDALERISSLEELLGVVSLSSASVEGNDPACLLMTGITWTTFLSLFALLSTFVKPCRSAKIPLREQLFLTILKLRHNLTFEHLADSNDVPKSAIINCFWKWIDLMYSELGFLIKPDRENVFQNLPPVFKQKFPRLTSIIGCFEVFVESPENLTRTFTRTYKKHTTIKFFMSCSPVGAVTFLSKAWGGRVSDAEIVRESGFISSKYNSPGDQILADQRLLLLHDFAETRAELLAPSFILDKKRISFQEVELLKSVFSARVQIECVLGHMKSRYSILKGTLPARLEEESLDAAVSCYDKVVTVCAALTNLGSGVVWSE